MDVNYLSQHHANKNKAAKPIILISSMFMKRTYVCNFVNVLYMQLEIFTQMVHSRNVMCCFYSQ